MIRPPARPGFTLVEILVATAIITALAGVALPAVQKVRASVSRFQCMNNLKQIGLALQNHEQEYKKLPPGASSTGAGWSAFLPPYLEQTALRDAMNFNGVIPWAVNPSLANAKIDALGTSLTACTERNIAAVETPMKLFQCPAMKSPKQVSDTFFKTVVIKYTIQKRCPATYIACTSGLIDSDSNPYSPQSFMAADGMFPLAQDTAPLQGLKLDDCKDGLSNTLLVGEAHSVLTNDIETTAKWGDTGVIKKDHWYFGSESVRGKTADFSEFLGSTAILPNYVAADASVAEQNKVEIGFSSPHMGGLNALFGDGSVHFIPNNIDPKVWANLGQRSDGNPTSIDF